MSYEGKREGKREDNMDAKDVDVTDGRTPSSAQSDPNLSAQLEQRQGRRGQTLVEFALSLPILLALLFGIIEFGRLFQSWVTLQNAARTAARYASTVVYNEDKYDIDLIVPCVPTDNRGARGTATITTRDLDADEDTPALTYTAEIYRPFFSLNFSNEDANDFVDGNPDYDTIAEQRQLLKTLLDEAANAESAGNDALLGNEVWLEWYGTTGNAYADIDAAIAILETNRIRFNNDVVQSEHLFATWYGGQDCDPSNPIDRQRRESLVRLASIYDQARIGASGLSLERSDIPIGSPPAVESYLYSSWENPAIASDERAWFDVVVCSAARRIYGSRITEIVDNADDPNSDTDEASLRFEFDPGSPQHPYGACLMKERVLPPPPSGPDPAGGFRDQLNDNYNLPWMDPGAPGDRGTLVVTYNHPLITPLGLAPYVQIRALRAYVNETFLNADTQRALGPSPGGGPGPEIIPDTPVPPTDEPEEPEDPPEPTPEPTDTPIPTNTPDVDFRCQDLRFNENPVYTSDGGIQFQFRNNNGIETRLLRVEYEWASEARDDLWYVSPGAYVAAMEIFNEPFWEETIIPKSVGDVALSINTDTDGTIDQLVNRNINAGSTAIVKIVYSLSPRQNISSYVQPGDLGNTRFVFENNDPDEDDPADCEYVVPVEPRTSNPQPTPECPVDGLTLEFNRFDTNGDVRLSFRSTWNVPATLIGLEINWPDRLNRPLNRIVAGGASSSDIIDPSIGNTSGGRVVWLSEETGAGGDEETPTSGVADIPLSVAPGLDWTGYTGPGDPLPNAAATSQDPALWMPVPPGNTDSYGFLFGFEPDRTTNIHLDFNAAQTFDALGGFPSDFNDTSVWVICEGLAGAQPIEVVMEPETAPTETPTPTPFSTGEQPPTPTPVDTATPEPTDTATNTPPPSNTPLPTEPPDVDATNTAIAGTLTTEASYTDTPIPTSTVATPENSPTPTDDPFGGGPGDGGGVG